MKYRLKKELPLINYKLGEIVPLDIDVDNNPITLYTDPIIYCTPSALDEMLRRGFLEEVKPREFTIMIGKYTDLHYVKELSRLKDMYDTDDALFEKIKVREVIE